MSRKYTAGDQVEHTRWKKPDGSACTGTVQDIDGNGRQAVQWHGTCVADELPLPDGDLR